MAWRCTGPWRETVQSLADKAARERLGDAHYVTRVRVPCAPRLWVEFRGRRCFPDAVAFVEGLLLESKGNSSTRGCIRGLPGSGKSYLLATLAAFFLAEGHSFVPVYISAHDFLVTPFEVLQLSLGISLGGDAARAKEVLDILSPQALLQWVQKLGRPLCFMVDDGDLVMRDQQAREFLNDFTDGRVLVYCAGAQSVCDPTVRCFSPLMECLDPAEATCFLGKDATESLPSTGYLPLLLVAHRRGELHQMLIGVYFEGHIDRMVQKLKQPRHWSLLFVVLAGSRLEPSSDLSFVMDDQARRHFFYIDKECRGAFLCEAMRKDASFRAIRGCARLGLEDVLKDSLQTVVKEVAVSSTSMKAQWNCTMAVTMVLVLQKVNLAVAKQSIEVQGVPVLAEWTPYFKCTTFLDSSPTAWPAITLVTDGKVFALQAGILEDLDPQRHYEGKQKFLGKVSAAASVNDPCEAFFVWIGCFGKHAEGGVAIHYDDHVDVFINYGQFHPWLSALETKFPSPKTSLRCHYMLNDRRCKSHALSDNILCWQHQRRNAAVCIGNQVPTAQDFSFDDFTCSVTEGVRAVL